MKEKAKFRYDFFFPIFKSKNLTYLQIPLLQTS